MLSRRKVLSSGVAAATALVLSGAAGAARTAAIAAPPTRTPNKPFIPQPAHVPADYVPGC
jgi:hypothetical protein